MTRKMKDSGIEWIGEIPEDWTISSLSKIAIIKTGSTPKNQFLDTIGEIDWIKTNNLKEEQGVTSSDLKIKYENKNLVTMAKKGATLVSCIGDIGKMAFLFREVSYNQQINAVNFNKNIHPKFGFYLLFSQKEQHKSFSNGNVLQILNSVSQGLIKVAFPELKEQKKISEILDKKTEQIENIKSTIKDEIQTLEDYKKSVITEAVTKGLDKNVEMKDSGIEWIGEIPKHWNISTAKYHINIFNGSDPKEEGDTPVYGSGEGVFKYSKEYKLGPAVLLGRKGTIGNPKYVERKYWNVDTVFNVEANKSLNLKFYFYVSTIFDYKKYITSTALPSMTKANYENMRIPYPNISEQNQIVDYLDKKTDLIDQAIQGKEKQLETLEEYKKSLIYEYVTGKKEVGDADCSFR